MCFPQIASLIVAVLCASCKKSEPKANLQAPAEETSSGPIIGGTTLISRPGSKMHMEGTSNIHDWQVETAFIGGLMEVATNFPTEPGQTVNPGKVDAKADVFITVRSLKSIKKDGSPYEDKMDEVMWGKLKAQQYPKIEYHLSQLSLKESAKDKTSPYLFDSKGDLAVAGVTNSISMPIKVTPLGEKKLKIEGATSVKMTDFKVEPPSPTFLPIKTGDEVKLIFTWMLAQKPATSAK